MKSLVTNDGRHYTLSPLSYEEFLYLGFWVGSAEEAWKQWLKHHGFSTLSQFDQATLTTSTIEMGDLPYMPLRFSVDGGKTWVQQDAQEPRPRGVHYLDHLRRRI